jgi:PAS domain S-box-containing protein
MTSRRSQILLDHAMLCVSQDGGIAHASQSWEHYEGLHHADMLERGVQAVILDADLPRFFSALERARDTPGQDIHVNCMLADRAYTRVEWLLSASPDGTVYATARRHDSTAQITGLPSRLLLDELLEAQYEVIAILNPDTSIRFLSDANERLLGYTQREFIELPVVDHIHPEDRDRVLSMLEDLTKSHDLGAWLSFDYRIRHKEGHWVEVSTQGKALRGVGEVRGFLLLTHGVSSSASRATSLEEVSAAVSERPLQVSNPKLEILSNEQALSLARENAHFDEIYNYVRGESSPSCLYEEERTRLMFHLDDARIALLELPPYEQPVTEILGSSMLRSFDHELRTPLNNIRGYTELLLEELEEATGMRRDLQKLHTSTRSLQRLLDNLVELTRLNSGDLDLHFERLMVDRLLEDLGDHIELLLDERGVALEQRNKTGNDAIYTDRARLLDALTQLIAFLAPRAEALSLEVVFSRKEEDRICFELSARHYTASREALSKALTEDADFEFDSNQREHLDVYMAARRFELLGGGLALEDDVGEDEIKLTGYLPLPSSDLDDVPRGLEEDYESEVTGEGPVILLIDGDEQVHTELGQWITETDYQLEHAYDGIRGLQIARDLMPTLIVLEIVVPRLDGWSILASIRREITLADTPVLILSVIEDLELAHALGATDLMHKPAKPQELLETIERLIAAN